MKNLLSFETKQELKKYRYFLQDIKTGEFLDTYYKSERLAQKMQVLQFKYKKVVYQIICKKG